MTNLPELHSSDVVYLQKARFIKMTLYLQKKGQLLELDKLKLANMRNGYYLPIMRLQTGMPLQQ